MCIRDRDISPQSWHQCRAYRCAQRTCRSRAAYPDGYGRGQSGYFFPPTGKSESCLLYTSDAADERSSVDLGGRRIIKKKNKQKKQLK